MLIIVDNSDIAIGDDCMISDGILFQSHDQHGLVDLETMKIINDRRRNIIVQDHVWIGRNATIMPGVTVAQGSVVAACAVVTKAVKPFTYVAGVPARQARSNATWSRNPAGPSAAELEFYERARALAPSPKARGRFLSGLFQKRPFSRK